MIEAEIIAIGNEVLSGSVVNSNAAFISQQLQQAGIGIARHSVFPDERQVLRRNLAEALARSPIVIASGGLGPTCDDLTRPVAAELFGTTLEHSEQVAADLRLRFGDALVSQDDQAMVPAGAHILLNTLGTAPGWVLEKNGSVFIAVPGVPSEMRLMMTRDVIPYLQKRFPETHRWHSRMLYLWSVRESEIDPALRHALQTYPGIDIGIYPREGVLAVRISTYCNGDGAALLDRVTEEIAAPFSDRRFESPSGTLEEALYNVFTARGLTLSVAESCTGGALGADLVAIPGASSYFVGGVIAYNNELKKKLLGVSEETLQRYGAVSEETVLEMARGVVALTGSSCGAAISGVAGPSGGTDDKPVGTVCFAVCDGRGGTLASARAWTAFIPGDRRSVIVRAAHRLMGSLYREITTSTEPGVGLEEQK